MRNIYLSILTAPVLAANSRGENEGNEGTIQTVVFEGEQRSLVKSEPMRYAMRQHIQDQFEERLLNRIHREDHFVEYADPDMLRLQEYEAASVKDRESLPKPYVDDDFLGGFKTVGKAKTGSKGKAKDGASSGRRGPLQVSPAISTAPWYGDVLSSFASPGAQRHSKGEDSTEEGKGDGKDKGVYSTPYGQQVHYTQYCYNVCLEVDRVLVPERIPLVLRTLIDLGTVGGNQSRYFNEYHADAIVVRVTDDLSGKINYCFDSGGAFTPRFRERVSSGRIDSSSLYLGGCSEAIEGSNSFATPEAALEAALEKLGL